MITLRIKPEGVLCTHQHMKMVWGVAVVLVLAAASVRADDLHLDVMQDELLGGKYYPNYNNSSWYINNYV